jgi:Holliday junction DNA helicase RuvA
MIASLRGAVASASGDRVVIEVCGVGYEVCVTGAAARSLAVGEPAVLYVDESVAMYGGGVTLYGFLTPAEKELFRAFRDCVPSTGAKKALEYLDKASKSLPDFRRAIIDQDAKLLASVFGFTRKTSDRLVESLKDKLGGLSVSGVERASKGDLSVDAMSRALGALSALGYRPAEARAALTSVAEEHPGESLEAESIIRLALKRL